MRKLSKAISVLTCALLLLTGCQSNKISQSQTDRSDFSQTADNIKFDYNESQIESYEPVYEPLPDLFETITECQKTVTVYGQLKDEKYAESVMKLQNILDGYTHNISLSVYSVDNSKALCYNTAESVFGACTVKAAYMLYACMQMENGNGNLNVPLTYLEKHYEDGTGDMQYSPFGTVFSMETAIYKSMSISDNVGYRMVVDYFGRDGYNSFVKEHGCESLQIKPTVWSLHTKAEDLVKIWRMIYNYFKTDTEYARFLYNSCTDVGTRPAAAIDGISYSHKQGNNSKGEWLSYSDAGIFWKGDTPYILAIITDAPGPSYYDSGIFSQISDILYRELF